MTLAAILAMVCGVCGVALVTGYEAEKGRPTTLGKFWYAYKRIIGRAIGVAVTAGRGTFRLIYRKRRHPLQADALPAADVVCTCGSKNPPEPVETELLGDDNVMRMTVVARLCPDCREERSPGQSGGYAHATLWREKAEEAEKMTAALALKPRIDPLDEHDSPAVIAERNLWAYWGNYQSGRRKRLRTALDLSVKRMAQLVEGMQADRRGNVVLTTMQAHDYEVERRTATELREALALLDRVPDACLTCQGSQAKAPQAGCDAPQDHHGHQQWVHDGYRYTRPVRHDRDGDLLPDRTADHDHDWAVTVNGLGHTVVARCPCGIERRPTA